MATLVFDIETIPDTALGRRLYGLDGVDDEEVAKAMSFRQLQETGSDFLPLHQHRVVAISCLLRQGDDLRVWSLGGLDSGEKELIQRFYDGIERLTPEIVSWNGGGFDLPVLHYRGLLHGVQAQRYWEIGDEDSSFRYNNYLNRFHWRHTDLMDVLSGFQGRGRVGLAEMSVMLGFPGKLGMAGDRVWDAWRAGELAAIRNYCETDVLNTWLIYLRFQHMRGLLDDAGLAGELARTRQLLADASEAHLGEFLARWDEST